MYCCSNRTADVLNAPCHLNSMSHAMNVDEGHVTVVIGAITSPSSVEAHGAEDPSDVQEEASPLGCHKRL